MGKTAGLWRGGMVAGGLLVAAVLAPGAAPDLKLDLEPLAPEVKRSTSFAPVVEKVAPSVVNIYTTRIVEQRYGSGLLPFLEDPRFRFFFPDPVPPGGEEPRPRTRRESNLGSAVIVTEDGYLLTNHHVVDGADEIKVAIEGENTEYEATVVGSDPQTDIAVLKIEQTGLPAATIGDSDLLDIGDTVLAIGNPFGVGQTVTRGIVSAKERGMGLVDYEDFIQTDASINPGNSGGALVDAQGRLMGINTAILSRTGGNQGIGFAVPINLARIILDRIVQEGKVTRGYLGVYIQPVTPGLARMFGLEDDRGALVGGVIPDSPAQKAGLKEGDVILALNGQPVDDSRDLRFKVAQLAPGSEVEVSLIRDGKARTLEVQLGELTPDAMARAGAPEPVEPEALTGALKDVELGALDEAARRQYSVPERVKGVLVTKVDPASAAYEAGLRPGNIILSINRNEVERPAEVLRLNREAGEDPLLLLIWSQGASRYVLVEPK